MWDHLFAKAETDAEKLYLLNDLVESIRTTIYRQSLFAAFELAVHTAAENGTPITAEFLDETYRGLIAKYPHNWRVSTAAFIWARVEQARGRHAAAAKAYALYRRRSPSGPLAEDALAGEARARKAAGQTSLARRLARSYLKKYPRGTHAKAMRSVMR